MTEKRFKMKKLEYEAYFIDSQQEYVDEDEPNFEIDGEKTLSDSQILDLLNENEQLKKEKEFWKGDALHSKNLHSMLSFEIQKLSETKDVDSFLDFYYKYFCKISGDVE